MILQEIFPGYNFKKFIDVSTDLLNDLYLFNLKGSINKQLSGLRQELPKFIQERKIKTKENESVP